ncbi:unnamed protein product [Psylliodes chrysocephalus]|uniref:Gag protein n=1 Tax=Psylliodes chrysocephalus TaxID=3402493 RepID=A0A9P0D9Z3_9CUCU|nr:unnamed protein product [Psylliodes chrysocephala]
MKLLEEQIANKDRQNIQENNKPNIQLPKIKLPLFDGSYDKWFSFHDIFQKVIHQSSFLTTIEKMQYLKTNIRGEASKIIEHLEITEDNYLSAWELLKKRYENKRLLVSTLVDKILDLPVCHDESVEKLKQLHDVTMECLNAIKNIGIETMSWGPIVTRIIMRKWDPTTSKLFEQNLTKPHEVPDLATVMEFLERRFQSLESSKNQEMPKARIMYPKSEIKTSYKNNGYNTCGYCNKDHTIYQCEAFKSLDVKDRNNAIKAMSSPKFCIPQVANCWISISIKGETTNCATKAISLKSLKRFLKLLFRVETIST